jgi:integrase
MGNATAPTRRTRRRSAGEGSVYRNGNRWRGAVTWTLPDGSRERRVGHREAPRPGEGRSASTAVLLGRTTAMGNATAPIRRTRRRSAGEGSVYRNGNRWRGAVTWTLPDGSRERRVVSAPTAIEAREKLDELRRNLRLGTLSASRVTVAAYLTDWLERDRARVRPSTWRSRESHVRVYLIPTLGRLPLAKLTATDVERAQGAFLEHGRPVPGDGKPRRGRPARPASPMTVRHVRATLRRALTEAVRDGRLGRNVAADASPPYVPHRSVDYLKPAEVRRLLDATAAHEYGALYALAATTGLRLGELLGLRWQDVDLQAGTLSVRRTLARDGRGGWTMAEPKSTRSRRTIPLPGLAVDALRRQRRAQDALAAAVGTAWPEAGLVFTDEAGRPCDPRRVSTAFQRAREAAGVPRIPLHGLRHSAATMMLAQGVPLAVISEWLGHAGISVTAQHYAAIVPQLARDAARAMDKALR